MKTCVSLIGLIAVLAAGCEQKSKPPPISPAPDPTATAPLTQPAQELEPAPAPEPEPAAQQGPQYRHGAFVWYEHWGNEKDSAKAKKFYDELMGWELEDTQMGDATFTLIKKGDMPIGMFSVPTDYKGKPTWMGYVSVADVDEAAQVAQDEGATLIAAPMDVPNVGRVAHLQDQSGAYFGLFKGAQGDPPMNTEPSEGDWAWMELWVKPKVKQTALDLYTATTGWTTQDMPIGKETYTVLMTGQQAAGGMDVPDKVKYAGRWVPYVVVDDVDDVFKRARKLKARAVMPPKDFPTVGRLGLVEDPTGAVIGFLTMPEQPEAAEGGEAAEVGGESGEEQ